MEQATENRRKLLHSLEFRVLCRNAGLYTLVIALAAGLTACAYPPYGEEMDLGLYFLFWSVWLVPAWIFYGSWAFRMLRKAERYEFCRCSLTKPHQNHWVKGMYFTVFAEFPGGRRELLDTRAIFQPQGFVSPLLEDYINRTVTIGYNPETGNVTVIG